MKPTLRLGWCSHDAARFACSAFHYSRALPAGKLVKVGAWEDGRFIGCVLFSRGASANIGRPYGLDQREVCELTRVALSAHRTPTSRIVAIALRMLRQQSPGVRLVVSFADPLHGHYGGGIYAAGGWLYVGPTARECVIRLHGYLIHPRSVSSRWGCRQIAWLRANVDATAERVVTEAKHKYLFPFDTDLRARLMTRVRPYPKRPKEQDSTNTTPVELGGASPTRPLHIDDAEAAHV